MQHPYEMRASTIRSPQQNESRPMSRQLKVSSLCSVAALGILCLAATINTPAGDRTTTAAATGAISAQTTTMSGLRD
jgi:hypothetical protein